MPTVITRKTTCCILSYKSILILSFNASFLVLLLQSRARLIIWPANSRDLTLAPSWEALHREKKYNNTQPGKVIGPASLGGVVKITLHLKLKSFWRQHSQMLFRLPWSAPCEAQSPHATSSATSSGANLSFRPAIWFLVPAFSGDMLQLRGAMRTSTLPSISYLY